MSIVCRNAFINSSSCPLTVHLIYDPSSEHHRGDETANRRVSCKHLTSFYTFISAFASQEFGTNDPRRTRKNPPEDSLEAVKEIRKERNRSDVRENGLTSSESIILKTFNNTTSLHLNKRQRGGGVGWLERLRYPMSTSKFSITPINKADDKNRRHRTQEGAL